MRAQRRGLHMRSCGADSSANGVAVVLHLRQRYSIDIFYLPNVSILRITASSVWPWRPHTAPRWPHGALVGAALWLGGCTTTLPTQTYQTVPATQQTATQRAVRVHDAGLTHAEGGELAAAEACFRDALILEPTYAAAHNNLGLALLRRGQLYEAALELQHAAELAPHAGEPVRNLALLYEVVGWTQDAITTYEQALRRQPDDAVARRRLAALRHACGQLSPMPVPGLDVARIRTLSTDLRDAPVKGDSR